MTSIEQAHSYIQGLRKKGHKYGSFPVYDVSVSDLNYLKSITDKYGIPFEWMINLINFESGRTFNPAIQNSIGATGLIQILKSTAKGLGTTTDALKNMSFKEYSNYIDKYLYANLKRHLVNGKVPNTFTQGDLFMTIFYPVAVGKPEFVFPKNVQIANAGIAKPYDYVQKALKVSLFPLSVIPYSLSEFKDKVVETAQVATEVVKKNPWKTIAAAAAITVILYTGYKLIKKNI